MPLPTNCLSVFDHFVGLAFKGLKIYKKLGAAELRHHHENKKNYQNQLRNMCGVGN